MATTVLRYRAKSEGFCKLLVFVCIVEVSNNLPSTATNWILPAKGQGCVPLINPSDCQYYSLRYVASHSNVLRGSSRVPAGTRDEPLRKSAWEAVHGCSLRCERLLVASIFMRNLRAELVA